MGGLRTEISIAEGKTSLYERSGWVDVVDIIKPCGLYSMGGKRKDDGWMLW